MISPVDPFLDAFAEAGADIITVHPEAGPHLHRTIQRIKALGKKAGVSLNPATPAKVLDYVLEEIDLVLVMSVNPGFGGQKFIASQLKQDRGDRQPHRQGRPRRHRSRSTAASTPTPRRQAIDAGATALVAGTAAFRGGAGHYAANIQRAPGRGMSGAAAARADIVGKLARGSLLSRLIGSRKPAAASPPSRATMSPATARAATRCLPAGSQLGSEAVPLAELDFAALGAAGPLGRAPAGLLLAARPRRRRRRARRRAARPRRSPAAGWSPMAPRADEAWAPDLWGERILFWTAYAPYILSSRDTGYRSALLNTLARGARHLDATADKAPPGLPRITAWCGRGRRRPARPGRRAAASRAARPGWPGRSAAAQFDDGGLVSRSPDEQVLLVDRLGLLRAAYFAAKQTMPDALETAAAAALAALHGVTLGDGALSSWQGGNPGDPARLAALIEGCGLRARPLRQARGWGYQRLSALGTILVLDAAPPPPPKMAASAAPRPWRSS